MKNVLEGKEVDGSEISEDLRKMAEESGVKIETKESQREAKLQRLKEQTEDVAKKTLLVKPKDDSGQNEILEMTEKLKAELEKSRRMSDIDDVDGVLAQKDRLDEYQEMIKKIQKQQRSKSLPSPTKEVDTVKQRPQSENEKTILQTIGSWFSFGSSDKKPTHTKSKSEMPRENTRRKDERVKSVPTGLTHDEIDGRLDNLFDDLSVLKAVDNDDTLTSEQKADKMDAYKFHAQLNPLEENTKMALT